MRSETPCCEYLQEPSSLLSVLLLLAQRYGLSCPHVTACGLCVTGVYTVCEATSASLLHHTTGSTCCAALQVLLAV